MSSVLTSDVAPSNALSSIRDGDEWNHGTECPVETSQDDDDDDNNMCRDLKKSCTERYVSGIYLCSCDMTISTVAIASQVAIKT
jgi:hypothetical protein